MLYPDRTYVVDSLLIPEQHTPPSLRATPSKRGVFGAVLLGILLTKSGRLFARCFTLDNKMLNASPHSSRGFKKPAVYVDTFIIAL